MLVLVMSMMSREQTIELKYLIECDLLFLRDKSEPATERSENGGSSALNPSQVSSLNGVSTKSIDQTTPASSGNSM